MTTLEGGTIGGTEFPLWVPNKDTPLIPLEAVFTAVQQSVLDNLTRLRTRFQSVQSFTGIDVIDDATGWQMQTAVLHVLGETYAHLLYQAIKKDSALVVPADGNVGNPVLGQLKAKFVPVSEAALGAGDAGRLSAGYVLSSGQVKLAALNSGTDVAVNDVLTFSGGYILANPIPAP